MSAVSSCDRDRRPGFGEGLDDGTTDAAGATTDHGMPALQCEFDAHDPDATDMVPHRVAGGEDFGNRRRSIESPGPDGDGW